MSPAIRPAARPIASVERGIAVLDALAASPQDLGTNEIARRTGINASSVSRLLGTLLDGGFVTHVAETGRYRLGVRLIQLGTSASERFDLRQIARPHLTGLADATGETATLSVPVDGEAITIDFARSASSVQSVAQLGRPSVPHATAIGKVLLASLHGLPDRPLDAYTDHTITDGAVLASEVARTAKRGWGRSEGEREADLNALAVPVAGGDGELRAILGLQGPAARFDRRAMRLAIDPLRASAAAIAAARW